MIKTASIVALANEIKSDLKFYDVAAEPGDPPGLASQH